MLVVRSRSHQNTVLGFVEAAYITPTATNKRWLPGSPHQHGNAAWQAPCKIHEEQRTLCETLCHHTLSIRTIELGWIDKSGHEHWSKALSGRLRQQHPGITVTPLHILKIMKVSMGGKRYLELLNYIVALYCCCSRTAFQGGGLYVPQHIQIYSALELLKKFFSAYLQYNTYRFFKND